MYTVITVALLLLILMSNSKQNKHDKAIDEIKQSIEREKAFSKELENNVASLKADIRLEREKTKHLCAEIVSLQQENERLRQLVNQMEQIVLKYKSDIEKYKKLLEESGK